MKRISYIGINPKMKPPEEKKSRGETAEFHNSGVGNVLRFELNQGKI